MLKETFSEIATAACDACRRVYGDRLIGVILFGSVAREEMRPDSDIDLFVVVEPLPQGNPARMDDWRSVEDLVAPVLDDARGRGVDTRIGPIVRTREELGQSGFLLYDIALDGAVLLDTDGWIADYLASVRKRLEERGAERRLWRGMPYWILDPNVRPGQVIEI